MAAAKDKASPLTAPSSLAPLHRCLHGGRSKTWASLARIIAVISNAPPPLPRIPPDLEPEPLGSFEADPSSTGRGLGIDLELRLGPPLEIGRGSTEEKGGSAAYSGVVEPPSPAESSDASVVEKVSERVGTAADGCISPAESVAGDALTAEKSSVGECDPLEVQPKREEEEEEEEARGGEAEEEERGNGSEGYLGLLLEAVRQVTDGVFDDEAGEEEAEAEEETAVEPSAAAAGEEAEASGRSRVRAEAAGSKRRRMCWTPPFDFYDDSGPVVRSKRGRNQVLPSRYRDSVLEPWAKPPTVHRPGSRRGGEPAGKITGNGSGQVRRR